MVLVSLISREHLAILEIGGLEKRDANPCKKGQLVEVGFLRFFRNLTAEVLGGQSIT